MLLALWIFREGLFILFRKKEKPHWTWRITPLGVGLISTLTITPTVSPNFANNPIFLLIELWLLTSCLIESYRGLSKIYHHRINTILSTIPLVLLTLGILYLLASTTNGLINKGELTVPSNNFRALSTVYFGATLLTINITMAFYTAGLLIRRIKILSESDPLTKCLNRRSIEGQLRVEFDNFLRTSKPVACIGVDLVGTKNINDKYGLAMGDLYIKHAARILNSKKGNSESLGRFSGDGFILLVPNSNVQDAFKLVNEIRHGLEQSPLGPPEDSIPISASFGVAILDSGLESCDNLISRTEKAIIKAKRSKSRIEFSPPFSTLHARRNTNF